MKAPSDGGAFEAVETHVSWVIFAGDEVFKVKKPVMFDFLDWRTDHARAAACREEIRLNRRLSPDVYEGVGRFCYPDGRVEPVVVMRRLPSESSLSALVRRGDSSTEECVRAVARKLAGFHLRARRGADVDANCGTAQLTALWDTNLQAIRDLAPPAVTLGLLDRAQGLAGRYLAGRTVLIGERIRGGRAVDGHGDLISDDIFCLEDGPRILDCLEFDPKLRWADTVADVAFLAMDLEYRGRPELAAVLIGEYQQSSGDRWPESWSQFWVAYRATVRAKVSFIRGLGGDRRATAEAQVLTASALTHLEQAQVRMLLVGGLPGSGKSTLSQAIGATTGWPVLSSDVIRRQEPGREEEASSGEYGRGLYSPDRVDANYRKLLSAARERLARGESVVLDATWSTRDHREAAARAAAECWADLVGLQCTVAPGVAHERILSRSANGGSEATPAVAAEMALGWEPWPEALPVDTTGSTETTLRNLSYLVGAPGS